jgi:hypothetical protein
MSLDTLAFSKHLQEAGVDRTHAEAHAEAMNRYLLPDLVTKPDLIAVEHRLTAVMHTVEIRILGIVGAMLGILFALIKLT